MAPLIAAQYMAAAACLSIALIHGVVWLRRCEAAFHGFFAITAVAVAGNALAEARMYSTTTIVEYNSAWKLGVVFLCVAWAGLTRFLAHYTGTVRRWLAYAVLASLALVLVVHLASPSGIHLAEIEALENVDLPWGERVSIAAAPFNAWKPLADVPGLLMIGLAVDACLRLWRRGGRRRVIGLAASLAAFMVFFEMHGR